MSIIAPPPSRPQTGVVLRASPDQLEQAKLLAMARQHDHNACRKPHETAGSRDRMLLHDLYGVLAELLVTDTLKDMGLPVTDVHLLVNRCPTGPDFRLNGIGYDVKAVLPTARFVTINEAGRLDPAKHPDAYLVCVFRDNRRCEVMQPLTPEEVGQWALRFGHSAYRSTAADRLAPLLNLRDLTHWRPDAS